jgi:hypothetical protein
VHKQRSWEFVGAKLAANVAQSARLTFQTTGISLPIAANAGDAILKKRVGMHVRNAKSRNHAAISTTVFCSVTLQRKDC